MPKQTSKSCNAGNEQMPSPRKSPLQTVVFLFFVLLGSHGRRTEVETCVVADAHIPRQVKDASMVRQYEASAADMDTSAHFTRSSWKFLCGGIATEPRR